MEEVQHTTTQKKNSLAGEMPETPKDSTGAIRSTGVKVLGGEDVHDLRNSLKEKKGRISG